MEIEKTFIELFAGVGLVGHALKPRGWTCVLANDICPHKKKLWVQNGGEESKFVLGDVRLLSPGDIPKCTLLTASFPCVDFSTAGKREGFKGSHSSTILLVLHILQNVPDERKPDLLLFENVLGSICSGKTGAADELPEKLHGVGYGNIDMRVVDAANFTSQSRKRVFTLAVRDGSAFSKNIPRHFPLPTNYGETVPKVLQKFMNRHPYVRWFHIPVPDLPPYSARFLKDDIDHSQPWTDCPGSPNLPSLFSNGQLQFARENRDVYKVFSFIVQTRSGKPTAEISRNGKAYCLRTGTGRLQAGILGFHGDGRMRLRYLTENECAALQGVPDFNFDGVSRNQRYKAMGDAVCVPVVAFMIDHVVHPLLYDAA